MLNPLFSTTYEVSKGYSKLPPEDLGRCVTDKTIAFRLSEMEVARKLQAKSNIRSELVKRRVPDMESLYAKSAGREICD
jgi:hypothetical protein